MLTLSELPVLPQAISRVVKVKWSGFRPRRLMLVSTSRASCACMCVGVTVVCEREGVGCEEDKGVGGDRGGEVVRRGGKRKRKDITGERDRESSNGDMM